MTTTVARPHGCVAPVVLDHVVDDPQYIRRLAEANGPYFMPARYLVDGSSAEQARDLATRADREVPSYLIGPVWRGDWVFGGQELAPGTAELLHHQGFIAAARTMFDAEVVVPEQVYVNLSGPMGGNPFSHVDIPEFVGIDRTNAPGWFLQAMGSSRLFEDVRITIATAVAWFHAGPRGYFRYWPEGREGPSVRHEDMWNTAVVGDNDFMHHKVERIGTDDASTPTGMTIDTELDHDGRHWNVVENGRRLASYDDHNVRLSLSWKAKVYRDQAACERVSQQTDAISIDEALGRFTDALGQPLDDTNLASPQLRDQLTSRWSGYVAG